MITIYFDVADTPNAWLHVDVDTFYSGIEGAQDVWDRLSKVFVMKSTRP